MFLGRASESTTGETLMGNKQINILVQTIGQNRINLEI